MKMRFRIFKNMINKASKACGEIEEWVLASVGSIAAVLIILG